MAGGKHKSSIVNAEALERIRLAPDTTVRLNNHHTGWTIHAELTHPSEETVKERAKELLQKNLDELARAQELLYASDTHALLIVLQAMDAAGKDGTIRHVMSGVSPQGCQVVSFKQPSPEELDHDFLWRYFKALPKRGQIGIFNRSHYEEVLVTRVHAEWLAKQHFPQEGRGKRFWQERYQDINSFERHMARNGTVILKFFLHISKNEQKRRLLERLEDPKKYWKFSAADLAERRHWNEYVKAYEEALSATSTRWAPWYVIPADHKWSARVLVAEVIISTIRSLKLKYPRLSEEERRLLRKARATLVRESRGAPNERGTQRPGEP